MLRRLLGGGPRADVALWATLAVTALSVVALPAQDPPAEPGQTRENAEPRRGEGRRGRAPVTVLRAGFVHPVSGPVIENGVVLIRGSRIVAVGTADAVEIPAGATVIEHPGAHVYPGFVDALSAAFAAEITQDGSVDAAAAVGDALDPFDDDARAVVTHGVTTAYVSNRSGATWRGQGALIRPTIDGYRPFPELDAVGVHMRLTTGPAPAHPLQRIKQLEGLGKEFEQLEAYEKARDEYAKKLEEYEKQFTEYLEWHRKRQAKKPDGEGGGAEPAEGAEKPAETTEPAGGGRRGGRRGPRPGGETPPAGEEPPAQEKPAEGAGGPGGTKPAADAKGGDEKGGAAKAGEDKAPERPKFPPEPKPDPAKDALLAVRDGDLALFVEAHRTDEVGRALELVREHELRRVVLELLTGAAEAVDRIAAAGVPVILETALPPAAAPETPESIAYVPEHVEQQSVAVRLAAAGVPFALGSGDVRRARHLPSLCAEAIGAGVDPDVALRAITLTPAEILGIADRVGSLEPRKLADLVVTSAPLDASDARVLRVMSAGTTVHEAR